MSLELSDLIAQLRLQFGDLTPTDFDYEDEDYEAFIDRGRKDLNFYVNTTYTLPEFPELWEPILLCAAWAQTMMAEFRRIGKLADHDVEGQRIDWAGLHGRIEKELKMATECVDKGVENIQKNLRGQRRVIMHYQPRRYPVQPGIRRILPR